MSSITSSDLVNKSPKCEKYKINSLLLMMNGTFEKNMRVDVSDMASVLQSVGFKLQSIGKTNINEQDNKDENELKITLSCGRSGLQAVYTKHDYVCNCQEDLSNEGLNEEICDNVVKDPIHRLTRRPSNLIRELLSSIITQKESTNVTNHEVEINEEFQTPMGETYQNNIKPVGEHRTDWEVDPTTSPPKMTSSPLADSKIETCSFCIEKEQKIAEMIEETKNQFIQSIDNALALLPRKNNTFTKKQFKRVSDIPKLPQSPSTPFSKLSCEIKTTVKRSTPKLSSRNIMDNIGTPVKNKAVTKPEKRNLISPKRGLLKNYSSPLNKKSHLEKSGNNKTPIGRCSPLDRRGSFESPLNKRSPLTTRSPLVMKNTLYNKNNIRKDTPMPDEMRLISPQLKTSKLARTNIPKLNNVNAVSSSTGSLSKKTGIPMFSKLSK